MTIVRRALLCGLLSLTAEENVLLERVNDPNFN